MNATNLEESRFRYDVLITSEAQHLKGHRALEWTDISERCIGSTRSGGKAHLFGRREISFQNKVAIMWTRKRKGVRAWR